jgi:hypothetical protein
VGFRLAFDAFAPVVTSVSGKPVEPSGVEGISSYGKSFVSAVELEVSDEERSFSDVFALNLDRSFAVFCRIFDGGSGNPYSRASSKSSGEDMARSAFRASGSL